MLAGLNVSKATVHMLARLYSNREPRQERLSLTCLGRKAFKVIPYDCSALSSISSGISTSALKHGHFCLRLELPKEVNFHFLLNKFGDLSFFFLSLFFLKMSGYFLPLE